MKLRAFFTAVALVAACGVGQARAQILQPSQMFGETGSGSAIRSATFASRLAGGGGGNGGSCSSCGESSCGCASSCESGCTDMGCASGGCGGGSCGCTPCICVPWAPGCGPFGWTYKVGVYGDYLYLRARNAQVAYATENNNLLAPPGLPIQTQRLGIVDHDYSSGFRFGFSVSPGTCSAFNVQYMRFESNTTDQLVLGQNGFEIASLVSHPATLNAAAGGIQSNAWLGLQTNIIDADYRELLWLGPSHRINYLVGGEYADLKQQFRSDLDINGGETVATTVNFYGGGLRFGMEGEHWSPTTGALLYGRGITSLLAGEFRTSYAQGQNFDASVVDTGWTSGRIVPVLNLEAGVGWMHSSGAFRVTAGYMYMGWYNTVTSQDWINAVRTNNYTGMSSTLTLDGLVGRIEGRF